MKKKALIYCRVSSTRQKVEGHGLESQEHRCRVYAEQKGYEVEEVFRDDYTGGGDFMKRPAMSKLLGYMDGKPYNTYTVVFDDLKRFARDTVFHWKLRNELKARQATPECLNFNFEDTPEGEFVETIMAAQGQLERKQNARQVIQKMKARLEQGYWPFDVPPGYKNIKHPIHGKLLVPDEPKATIIRQALEGFAYGIFLSQTDVQMFLQEKDFFHRKKKKKVHLGEVGRLLNRLLYTGFVEYPNWDVGRRKGHHEPIISLEVFEMIQGRLKKKNKLTIRKDGHNDFPLRGGVLCSYCLEPLTASWTTKRQGAYRAPYYRCKTGDCVFGGKSIRRDFIEPQFEGMLKELQPKKDILALIHAIVLDVWKSKTEEIVVSISQKTADKIIIEEQIDSYLKRISKIQDEKLIGVYENKVGELNAQLVGLDENIAKLKNQDFSFETALDIVFDFLKSPYSMWKNGELREKKTVLKLIFRNKLSYAKDTGFGTADLPVIMRLFDLSESNRSQLVEMERLNSRPKLFPESVYLGS